MRARLTMGLLIALGVGCGSDADVLTYEEFKAQAYQDPESGVYVINGDEVMETEAHLRDAYDGYLQSVADAADRAEGYSTIEQTLIVNRVNGADDKWSASQALNLTYCISKKSFGSRYNTVVDAMNAAAGAWESAARVNFIHDAGKDGNCTTRTNVVFNVAQVCRGQYLASAFFPSYSRRNRQLTIDCTSFGNISPWTLTGVLRHELGHALGFRHEHTRPEAGVCFENNSWRALTAYDAESVMHYPQCNGTQDGDLVLTNLDKSGASALYP